MRKIKIIISILVIGICLVLSSCASLFLSVENIPGSLEEFTITSEYTNSTYHLYVYLPAEYTQTGGSYPVLYKLDGDSNKGSLREAAYVQNLQHKDVIAPFIIAAIGYEEKNQRKRDYAEKPDKFASFIVSELIPEMDSRYNTIADKSGRTIAGGSLGGIAVIHMLFNQNQYFSNYISLSPSLLWDDTVYFSYEKAYAEKNADLNANLYTSVGREEGIGTNVSHKTLCTILTERGYPSFTMYREAFDGKGHMAAINCGFEKGVLYVYKK